MLDLRQIHHTAITTMDYAVSKALYCDILDFMLQSEVYHEAHNSWKGDLALNGQYVIEPFPSPLPSERPNRPETCGLRHLAFSVDDIGAAAAHLESHNVKYEVIRVDLYARKRFAFFSGPDGLPLELYEQQGLSSPHLPGNASNIATVRSYHHDTHARQTTFCLTPDSGGL